VKTVTISILVIMLDACIDSVSADYLAALLTTDYKFYLMAPVTHNRNKNQTTL
jgi:hypothetical protein